MIATARLNAVRVRVHSAGQHATRALVPDRIGHTDRGFFEMISARSIALLKHATLIWVLGLAAQSLLGIVLVLKEQVVDDV